nr:oligopeptide transporter [Tanacetum cinerariifolium]
MHHYERFTTPSGRRFVDGMVATIDPVELESFSTSQMKLILTNCLGYNENSTTFLYIKKPSCSLDSRLIPLDDAIQDNELILTYIQTQYNRLHVYVSRVKLSPLVVADQSKDEAMDFEDMVSYLTRRIPKRFITLYYTLPSNHMLSGLKAIKNDYDTNVMYKIAKVSKKLQIYAAHHPIDLSTVLIPNDGSLEKSFAELQAEVTLANKLSRELTRIAEQMCIREIHMAMLHAMPLTSLNSYGLHALLMTHESDIRITYNLRTTRDELLRSIAEK